MNVYQDSAPANHLLEITFQSKTTYKDPFFDIQLDVVFSNPSGQQHTIPAYWTGENKWAVRYSSSLIGKHQFTSTCSDSKNKNLHHIQGSVEVTAYTGSNPLLSSGAPIIAADNRHLCHADNTPFFWLGDTWWMGLTKRLNLADFKMLAKDRQKKGFTIIQIVAGLYPDMAAFDPRGESKSGHVWKEGFNTINPAFFDEADTRILHLVSLGISPCILGCWGYYLQWLGADKMKLHWRYIIARWGALPVVWTASGEQTMPWYLSEQKESDSKWLKHEWTKVIQYIHQINAFDRLITTHPPKSARACVDDPTVLDFEMQQTGHHSASPKQAAKAGEGWHTKPQMPVVNGESRYEGLEIKPKVTSSDSRQAFWAHMLNSGCAGHTYGANGIWQVNLESQSFGKSPNGRNWGTASWEYAMHLPGSTHLSFAKTLLLTLPWNTFEPLNIQKARPSVYKWQGYLHQLKSFFSWAQQPLAAAISKNKQTSIFYITSLKPLLVDAQLLSTFNTTFWFDPTSAVKTKINQPKTSATNIKIAPPGHNSVGDTDWVLVLSTKFEQ